MGLNYLYKGNIRANGIINGHSAKNTHENEDHKPRNIPFLGANFQNIPEISTVNLNTFKVRTQLVGGW